MVCLKGVGDGAFGTYQLVSSSTYHEQQLLVLAEYTVSVFPGA